MQEFRHNDLVLGFPPRWIDASVVAIAGPPNGEYSPSIAVIRERLEFRLTLSEYANNQLAALQQALEVQNYSVLQEGTVALPELTGYQRIHTFVLEESGMQVTQMQLYFVRNTEAITITCTHASVWFERAKPTFMEAINQFRWS
jgi:hypothetical protein